MSKDARLLHQLLKIGSARTGRALPTLEAPLDTLLPVDEADPDARLWLSLGALDLWERSGFQPAPAASPASPVDAAPAEILASCPARAEALLALLLRGVHPAAVLSEWLQLLRRHGARLPTHFLPKLLDMATRQPPLRPLAAPVLGERGRWLGQLQPEWSWAAMEHGSGQRAVLWDTGSIEQRAATLMAWRVEHPGAARQALMDAWQSEPPEHRATLLPALGTGLVLEDEAFLESALDDRRKEVRAVAQRLLAQLPGSQLSQRMLERLAPLLQLERRLLRSARLQLGLPAECDAPMRRDGVGAGPHPRLGEKAGWVVDMLAAVDPHAWSERFACTPRACLALLEGGDFAAAFVRGWALAAAHRAANHVGAGRLDWLRELAHWWLTADPALRDAVPDSFFAAFGAAFRDDREAVLSGLLDAFPGTWPLDPALVRLLHGCSDQGTGGWPPALSRRVLQRLGAALPLLPALPQPWLFRQMLSSLALTLDPMTAAGYANDWQHGQLDSQWRDAFDQFFSIVRFRHEMTLSFQEPA